MTDQVKTEHVKARQVLGVRYKWEIEALAQDVVNKLEMGILLSHGIVGSYLSNLIKTHPRTKSRSLAAETIMASGDSIWEPAGNELGIEDFPGTEDNGIQEQAYYTMVADILTELERKGVSLS